MSFSVVFLYTGHFVFSVVCLFTGHFGPKPPPYPNILKIFIIQQYYA